MKTLIKAKYIIACKDDEFVLLENSELVYENDKIVFIGKKYDNYVDEVIDASNHLVSPGMIDLNALGDIDHELFYMDNPNFYKGYFDWAEDYFDNERSEVMSIEEESFKSKYAYIHLLRNGTTTAMPITNVMYKKSAETYEEIVAAAENAAELGLRIYLGPSFISKKQVRNKYNHPFTKSLLDEEIVEGMDNAEKFIINYHGKYDGLINAVVVPERIELQTEQSIIKSKNLAKQYDVIIRMHAAQGSKEYNLIKYKTGLSPVQYLDKLGFLDNKTLLPHAIYTSGSRYIDDKSDDDLNILRDRGVSVIHCPTTFSRAGIALDSFGRFVRHGINMTLGTDDFPSDIFRNITLGTYLSRLMDGGTKGSEIIEFFKAGTINAAKALGRNDIGKLQVDAKADIIIINLDKFEMGIVDDPLATMCLSGSGDYVDTSIINGRVVMKDRLIPNIDLDEIKQEAKKYYNKMKLSFMHRSNLKGISTEEFFPSLIKKL